MSGGLKYLLERGRGARQARPMNISIGRIVHYVLSQEDADKINRRRTTGESIAERIRLRDAIDERIKGDVIPMSEIMGSWPIGAQAHIGNTVELGMEFPAMCVRDWRTPAATEEWNEKAGVNLQVFLDGTDVFWATSVHEDRNTDKKLDPTPGTWHWPVQR